MRLVRLSQRKSFYSYSICHSALWADAYPEDRKKKPSYNFFSSSETSYIYTHTYVRNMGYRYGSLISITKFLILFCLTWIKSVPFSIQHLRNLHRSRYSDSLWAGWQKGRISNPGIIKTFLFSTLSRSVLEPTQPPIQCVGWALSQGVKRPGVKLTTHLQLALN
jgi:hypothetical protein